jgi:hypothetical protein
VFLPPSSATLFLCRWPSIADMFLLRRTVREEEAREGAPGASLEHIDVAEERVGFSELTRLEEQGVNTGPI